MAGIARQGPIQKQGNGSTDDPLALGLVGKQGGSDHHAAGYRPPNHLDKLTGRPVRVGQPKHPLPAGLGQIARQNANRGVFGLGENSGQFGKPWRFPVDQPQQGDRFRIDQAWRHHLPCEISQHLARGPPVDGQVGQGWPNRFDEPNEDSPEQVGLVAKVAIDGGLGGPRHPSDGFHAGRFVAMRQKQLRRDGDQMVAPFFDLMGGRAPASTFFFQSHHRRPAPPSWPAVISPPVGSIANYKIRLTRRQ